MVKRVTTLKNVTFNVADTTPGGWLEQYMSKDLEQGFIGNLDILAKDLIIDDDIYGKQRRSKGSRIPDLGILETGSESAAQYAWWNSETQSNWLDGFFRTSAVLKNESMLKKASEFIENKLQTQDEDGYIGIYEKDIRYLEDAENGELWAQSTLMRALLGYYEYTKDASVLEKIKRALDLTMENYPINNSRPFSTENEDPETCCCGLSHGLTITDAYLELYRITNDKKYLDYCVFLYESYCKEKNLESDITMGNLNKDPIRFKSHGVHTYEHLRALIIYAYTTGNKEYLDRCIEILDNYLNPSGGPVGDEWVVPEGADATLTGYEYCSIHELLHSYCLMLQITGETSWADRVEWLMFNAGRGARHPKESSIAYLKSDNSYSMKSVFQMPQPHCHCKQQTRYKYSPVHQDVAVCCVPNAGRIIPYYLQNMWQKADDGFVKMLYGPSVFHGEYDGCSVTIEEMSSYPMGNEITLRVYASTDSRFTLYLRKPSWWTNVTVLGSDYEEDDHFLVICREWGTDTMINIRFEQKLCVHSWKDGEYYLSYGANVLALPIDSIRQTKKTYSVYGLEDTEYLPENENYLDYALPSDIEKRLCDEWISEGIPMWNNQSRVEEKCKLVPMGNTILRKVTFKKKEEK